MSVRSFHSVFMASAVAGAALGCYLVSLRVASERAALEQVESQIIGTEADIRLLQTEIGTRGRLAQLERWNVRVLDLSAPTADQILGDKFQLAALVRPEKKLPVEAPVILASARAPQPAQPLANNQDSDSAAQPAELLHEASLEIPARDSVPAKSIPDKPAPEKPSAQKSSTPAKKAGEKKVASADSVVTKPVRTAKVDPLAPLPAEQKSAKGSLTQK